MTFPRVHLGDVCDLENGDRGVNYPSKDSFVVSGIPFINAGNLSAGVVDCSGMSFISEEHYGRLSAGKVREGDIVFCLRGSLGKFAVVSGIGRGAIASSLVILRPRSCLDLGYLRHFLGSELCKREIMRFENGAAQPNLSGRDLKLFDIPLPPLSEQKRIAAILDKANAIRRKRQQAIQLADDFLRAVFQDMFGDSVTNPKGWDELVLKEIADIRSGVTKGKVVKPDESVTLPYMRVANVQDGYLDLEDVQDITVSVKDAEKCQLLKGDILLTEGGDPDKLGRGHVWNGEIENCLHQNHIFSVRVKNKEIVRPAFLSAIISSQRGKQYFLKVGKQTTGIATINKTVLSEFVPFLPPVALQDKFLAMMGKIDSVKLSLGKGDCGVFKSLSQKAFSGQL
ncbi:restriction endonuclease subunit S [Azotobacter beijerinckii]|uniref:restriction endonuclease subunit S n=1 Tax=Azotobacter beijerinckii TaxID=170623 RepID=UPI0029559433|nr:restriction endonuclease subunit S [Azotobacter beijerinckii]MDV7212314.1 restriction endonuclease subunit S [Azotobacter beijerinckii]